MILALLFGMIILIVFVGIIFNKEFWQGYRNSKFIDELMSDDQVKSDSKELM